MVWSCWKNGRQETTSKAIIITTWREHGVKNKDMDGNVGQDLAEKDMDLRTALHTIRFRDIQKCSHYCKCFSYLTVDTHLMEGRKEVGLWSRFKKSVK